MPVLTSIALKCQHYWMNGSTWDKHSPQILWSFSVEKRYLLLTSPAHPMVSVDINGCSTDFPAVFLLHIFRLSVGVNYFGRHLHHQTCIFRQDSSLSYFAMTQACGVSFLSRCSPILTDPIFVASLSAQIAYNSQIKTHAHNHVCYIRSFSTNFGLLDCTPLIGKIGARVKCRC